MNATNYFHLLFVVSHHIVEFYGGNDIARMERACGNQIQLTLLRTIMRGNTVHNLEYNLSSARWILARFIHPARVLINRLWDECDLVIFSEVVSNVREIELHGARFTQKQLLNLLQFCLTPQRLCISSPTALCQTGLTSLIKACTRGCFTLVDLEFHIAYLKRATLVAILKRCPALQSLDVRDCPVLNSGESLQDILTYCPSIRSICVDRIDSSSDGILPSLAMGCKELRKIHFEGAHDSIIYFQRLSVFFSTCAPMEKVVLLGIAVSEATATSIVARSAEVLKVLRCTVTNTVETTFGARFIRLRELDMTMSLYLNADELMINIAQHCPLLETLVQRNCERCTDAAVMALATHSTQLKQLSMFRCLDITPRALDQLVRCCRELTHLHLTRIRSSASEIAAMVRHCPQLTSFQLGEPFLSRWDVALHAVTEQMKGLKHLYLSGYHLDVRDATVLHLVTACKTLQTLHILQIFFVCKDIAIVHAMDRQNGSHMKDFHVTSCTPRVYRALVALQLHCASVKEEFRFYARIAVRVGCC